MGGKRAGKGGKAKLPFMISWKKKEKDLVVRTRGEEEVNKERHLLALSLLFSLWYYPVFNCGTTLLDVSRGVKDT